MAIIQTIPGPYVLDALNEEITFGPGKDIDTLDLDDTESFFFNLSATAGTWTITSSASLDGTNWVNIGIATYNNFGSSATVSGTGSTVANIYQINHSNIPYLRLRMTAYTSGVVTLTTFVTRRTGTR